LILLSNRFADDTRIDFINPITIGLIFLATLSVISLKIKIINIMILTANALGIVGAFFYFMHWPYGFATIIIWLICRLYINYEMFIDNLGPIKIFTQITLFFSLIQTILIFKTYWLTAGLSGLVSIILAILALTTMLKKENGGWIKDYVMQLGIQNIFILAWIISSLLR
jgi:hypothetical protein